MKMLTLVLLCFGISSALAAVLPSEFRWQSDPQGLTLIWSSETVPIHVGGSRYEFRFSDGTVLGYPSVLRDELQLSLTPPQLQTFAAQETTNSLQVWVAGRRIDADAPPRTSLDAAASAPSSLISTPTVAVDPAARGTYTVRSTNYNVASINIEGYPVPIEVKGDVRYPKNASGPRPLILFLHGRHATCYEGGPTGDYLYDWPCPSGYIPIPSHQGYRYIADILASQGYIVVSISANAITTYEYNEYDGGSKARSMLIRHHLSRWAQWNASGGSPFGNLFKGKVNMYQVVLVGHQLGGEGVHRAAIDASPTDPYKIVGLVTYGATSYNHQVTPDIHSVNILPTCDGDVADLSGQVYVDASRDIAYSEALRSAVISVGTNNNFFNTEWTPGLAAAPAFDDWDDYFSKTDALCGSQGGRLRLTHDQQRKVGATYTAAFIKMVTNQDVTMLPLLDGSFLRPAAIFPAEVAVNAVGGAKNRLLYRPEDSGKPTLSNGMTGNECLGNFLSTVNIPLCTFDFFSPHWNPFTSRPSPLALELVWTDRLGSTARFSVSSALQDLSSLDSLDVRIANHPENGGVSFDLMIADKKGKSAKLLTSLATIESWPYSDYLSPIVHARTFRGSIQSVKSKVDLKQVAAVVLVSKSASGHVWVLDISASQARIQVPTDLNLPKLSLETATVRETDSFKQYALKIFADRPLTSSASVWLENLYYSGNQVDLVPGSSTVVGQILIDHAGDNIYSPFSFYRFNIEAIKGVVIGDPNGILTIEEDEPPPVLSVTAKDVSASEGQSLTWNFQLSVPTTGINFFYSIVAPTSGKELSSQDVPAAWLNSMGISQLPSIETKLSELGLYSWVTFGYGSTTAQLKIPLSNDGKPDANEVVMIVLENYIDEENVETIYLTGRVP